MSDVDWKIIAKAIAVVLIMGALLSLEANADVPSSGSTANAQSNNAGSNTAITGGYESSTTYQSGSSSSTTTNNETNNSTNQKTAVNSASAPSMSVYGQDSCVIPLSAGVTVIGFSGSFGSYHLDLDCQRRKSAVLLNKLGMKVASISLMCQDKQIWQAMMDAGTPCPIDGLIGAKAKEKWLEKRRTELKNVGGKPSMTWNK